MEDVRPRETSRKCEKPPEHASVCATRVNVVAGATLYRLLPSTQLDTNPALYTLTDSVPGPPTPSPHPPH